MSVFSGQNLTAPVLNGLSSWQPIPTVGPLTGSQPTIPLSGWGTGFNRLWVCWRVRASDAVTAERLLLQINGDSTVANYLSQVTEYNGSGFDGGFISTAPGIEIGVIPGASATAKYFGSGDFIVDGVSDATNETTATGKAGAIVSGTSGYAGTYHGVHSPAGPVTSLTLLPIDSGGQCVAGCQVSVFASV